MELLYTLEETMEARFTDRDEMEDINRHGINCGYHGFIYTYEIEEFFNKFEDEIEDYFYDHFGSSWLNDIVTGCNTQTISELKVHCEYSYVESWINWKVEDCEEQLTAA